MFSEHLSRFRKKITRHSGCTVHTHTQTDTRYRDVILTGPATRLCIRIGRNWSRCRHSSPTLADNSQSTIVRTNGRSFLRLRNAPTTTTTIAHAHRLHFVNMSFRRQSDVIIDATNNYRAGHFSQVWLSARRQSAKLKVHILHTFAHGHIIIIVIIAQFSLLIVIGAIALSSRNNLDYSRALETTAHSLHVGSRVRRAYRPRPFTAILTIILRCLWHNEGEFF